ncbi:hypothetical protein P3L10_033365 [Capsicum annuum]
MIATLPLAQFFFFHILLIKKELAPMTASLLSEIKSNKELQDQYDVVSPDTVSVSSLGKRSTTEEPIKKKNPAVVKISLWTLAQLNAEDVSKSTAENSLACSNKELHWFRC